MQDQNLNQYNIAINMLNSVG